MLIPVPDLPSCLARWTGRSLPRRVVGHWLAQGAAPEDPQPRWFIDSLAAPAVLMRLHGNSCTIHGDTAVTARALAELHRALRAGRADWADAELLAGLHGAGPSELQLNRVATSTLRAAYAAGFRPPPGQPQPHYSANAWYILGPPRFAAQVVHPARVVHDEELLPLLLADNGRDEANYIRACLRAGPSFVVEVGGEAVSWGCTHLGGAIGRLYTRPELRGKGYGKSLTALQVDTMLALNGIAGASVRVDNAASYRMFQALGARHIRGPLTWSRLLA